MPTRITYQAPLEDVIHDRVPLLSKIEAGILTSYLSSGSLLLMTPTAWMETPDEVQMPQNPEFLSYLSMVRQHFNGYLSVCWFADNAGHGDAILFGFRARDFSNRFIIAR